MMTDCAGKLVLRPEQQILAHQGSEADSRGVDVWDRQEKRRTRSVAASRAARRPAICKVELHWMEL